MKKLTAIFCSFMKKNIKFYANSSIIFSLTLIVFGTWMPGLVSTCFAQAPWTQKADMKIARKNHSSCVLDGKIYAIGGRNQVTTYNTMEVYDPALDGWTSLAGMNSGRVSFSALVFDGKILAIGGSQTGKSGPIISIEEYDPVSDTWTHKTDMPRARLGLTAAMLDGKIYIMGGWRGNFIPIAEVDVYDPVTDKWTTANDLKTPRWWAKSVVLNGKIYVIGGEKSSPWNGIRTVEEYDPATDNWSTKADMITGRKNFAACVLNGMIYVFGGTTGNCSGIVSSVEAYDTLSDKWVEKTNMPSLAGGPSAAQLNGKAYVSGGSTTACVPTDPLLSTMYEYNPHHDLFPLIEKIEVDKSYVKAGTDSICITTKMRDPTGITLMAQIEAPDQTPVDSLQLFDDGTHNDGNAGDSLFANVWPVSYAEERHYNVDLKITRTNVDTVINYSNSISKFTTIGPVTLEGYPIVSSDTVFDPGDRIDLTLTLKNNGSTVTAPNIKAKLTSLDTLVSVSAWSRTFGDIDAGKSSTSDYYRVMISDEWSGIAQVPLLVEIISDNFVYWKDTLIIPGITDVRTLNDPGAHPVKIYPNPAIDVLNIEINHTGNQGLEIEILTITGELISRKEYKNINAHFTEQIDLSGYAKGIYMVKVRQANAVYVGKVVVR